MDNQLRGWFKLDPLSNGSMLPNEFGNEIPDSPHPRPRKQVLRRKQSRNGGAIGKSQFGNTAIDHYLKPETRDKTGNLYHMVIGKPDVSTPKVS